MVAVRALTRAEIISVWSSGGSFTLIDLKTGIRFNCKGGPPINYDHTDWMYASKADYDTVIGFAGRSWSARPAILEISGRQISAVSYHTFNHSISVASGYKIVSPQVTRANEKDKNGNWNPGHHMCMHYIDTHKARSSTNYTTNMHNAVIEAVKLSGNMDPSSIQTVSMFGGSESNITPSKPVARSEPPVVMREGNFILEMTTDIVTMQCNGASIRMEAHTIPFILIPSSYKLDGKSATELIGYCGMVVNMATNNAQACIIGGTNGNGYRVSVRAGWGIGAEREHPSKPNTPNMIGEFTLAIFNDFAPDWREGNQLISQIENECSRRLSASLAGMGDNSRAKALSGGTGNPASIDPTLIDKYMVTINRNTGIIDYTKLIDIGVVGVCLEAGYLINPGGMSQKEFMNPQFERQIDQVKAAGLDFSLYMETRAHNVQEATKEMREFAYFIRKWPPVLGVWLKVNFSSFGNTPEGTRRHNGLIVDEYYRQLVSLGLVGKVGFYCSRDQLKMIDWQGTYKDTWYWWMIEPVQDVSVVDSLLTPEFFMYERVNS